MIHLFNDRGQCVLTVDGNQPQHIIEANMQTFGATTVVDCPFVGRLQEICLLNGTVQKRPVNPTILDGLWLRRVPVPATVYINGTSYPSTASDIELSFPYSSTYSIRVESFPFADANFEVTV